MSSTATRAASSQTGAGSTNNWLRANGQDDVFASGDYVSDTPAPPALGTYYRFFIEVPPGLAQLVVEVFDADVGRGGNGESFRDLRTSGSWNASVDYSLYDPAGTRFGAVITCSNAATPTVCTDSAWSSLFGTVSNPAAGHWELRVDMRGGDDTAGFGIRAHDGVSGSGGTELPVYAHSYVALGPTSTTPQSNTIYPWVTSGCQVRFNDFDFDSVSGASLAYSAPNGFAQTYTTVSGNGAWASNLGTRFTDDADADGYGTWRFTANIARAGGAAANIGTYYLGAFNAAIAGQGGAPTTQPEANTFRLYLPTDGGAAPAKPIVEQFVRGSGGPNPPLPGQTSRLTVTVRVINPTTRPIVFSAGNTVTTTVPGGAVVFAGNQQTSQGAVTTPAIGGSGTLAWNPGTVDAGATVILAYEVDVTPATSGQRIAVTGTPTANGTIARYVDETGNTSQVRATAVFGPLCEVGITAGVATRVDIASVRAGPTESGVEYEVVTRNEVGTLAFGVERLDESTGVFVPVHDKLLPALPPSPYGRVLHIEEPGGPRSGNVTLRIREIEARAVLFHGPFTVEVGGPLDVVPDGPRTMPPRIAPHPPRLASARLPVAPAGRRPERLEVRVTQRGVQRIPSALLADSLLRSPVDLAARLATAGVRVTRDGSEVHWTVAGGDLVFWGEAGMDAWQRDGVYELRLEPGQHMDEHAPEPDAVGAGAVAPAMFVVEADSFPVMALPLAITEDFWVAEAVAAGIAGFEAASARVDAPRCVAADGTLTVELLGGTPAEHLAQIRVDGIDVGTIGGIGIGRFAGVVPVPGPLLADDCGLDVELIGLEPADGATSIFFLDSLALNTRVTLAPGTMHLGEGSTLTAAANGGSLVLDVSDALHPRVLARGATGRLTFAPPSGASFVVADGDAYFLPRVVPDDAPNPLSGVRALDVAVIAGDALGEAAGRLADAHRQRGLASRVFDVDDIYDAYGHGQSGPAPIRAFLRDARARANLRFVVLAGAGSLDERGLLGSGDALLPVPLRTTSQGIASHDASYADTDDDGVPDLGVGRLPLTTPDEINVYAARLAGTAPPQTALMANDDDEPYASFSAAAASMGEQVPWTQQVVDLRATPLAEARQALHQAMAAGLDLLVYVGHGGLDRLASEGLLTSADVDTLAVAQPFVAVGVTCTINRFEDPGFAGLGERLVMASVASAVIAPATIGLHDDGERYGNAVLQALYSEATVGDAMRVAAATVAAEGHPDIAASYVLLGDPTVPAGGQGQFASCSSTPVTMTGASLMALFVLRWRRRR